MKDSKGPSAFIQCGWILIMPFVMLYWIVRSWVTGKDIYE